MALRYLSRMLSSTATRYAGIALSTIGLAVVVKVALDSRKLESDLSKPKRTPGFLHHFRSCLSSLISKSWGSRFHYFHKVQESTQNETKCLSGDDDISSNACTIQLRDTLHHTITVNRYLNDQFYLRMSRSLSTPLQINFDKPPLRLINAATPWQTSHAVKLLEYVRLPRAKQTSYHDTQTATILDTNRSFRATHNIGTHYNVLINAPVDTYTLSAEFPRWSLDFISAQINETACALAKHFQVDVDFPLLLEYGIPPPGFEACMFDEDLIPPGPHEEPLYIRKSNLRAKAPKPSSDFQSRFKAATNPRGLTIPTTQFALGAARKKGLALYHKDQSCLVENKKASVANSELSKDECENLPEAADYIVYHAFNMAYTNEMQARHLQMIPTPNRQQYMLDHPEYFEDFVETMDEADSYWLVHADEFNRYFPGSSSDSNGGQSPSTPAAEPEPEPRRSRNRGPEDYTKYNEEISRVLNDPAVVCASINRRCLSNNARNKRNCTTTEAFEAHLQRNSFSIQSRIFSGLHDDPHSSFTFGNINPYSSGYSNMEAFSCQQSDELDIQTLRGTRNTTLQPFAQQIRPVPAYSQADGHRHMITKPNQASRFRGLFHAQRAISINLQPLEHK